MKKKILIVEDEREMAQLETLRLAAHGYEVLVAYDGESGLEMVRKDRPDLVLLDIMLPTMDGYEVCRQIKKDPACRSVPVVLVSAVDQKFDTDLGHKVGAEHFFTKPFEPAVLLSKIKELTRKTPQP